MEEKVIRYAVIGCGEHAWRGHVEPAIDLPGLELTAAFDPDSSKMEEFERKLGHKLVKHADMSALYKDEDIDAVVVASPDRFHVEAVVNAGRSGKHSLVEKPLAVTGAEMEQLRYGLHLAAENGVVVTSCHPRRFDPPYLWVKKNLPELIKWHGSVMSIETDFSYHAPTKTGLHTGLLMDHVNHEFDLMNWLLGRSETYASRLADSEYRYQAAGVRKDGIAFTFAGTRLLKSSIYPETLRIRFERGELHLDCHDGRVVSISHETGSTAMTRQKDRASEAFYPGATDYRRRFRGIMANFRDAILGKAANYLEPLDLELNTAIGIALTEDVSWTHPCR